jgi:hypothetical protein
LNPDHLLKYLRARRSQLKRVERYAQDEARVRIEEVDILIRRVEFDKEKAEERKKRALKRNKPYR